MTWLIKNVRVLNPASGLDRVCDLLLADGKIKRIGLVDVPADRVLDGTGLVAAPGLVDMHCHLRDPGQTHKEDIASGTLAAALGGFTSVCCMPNTQPVCDSTEVLLSMAETVRRTAHCRVYPIAAVTLGQAGETLADFSALAEAGAVAFSDDGHPVPTALLMRDALLEAQKLNRPVISHCEDMSLAAGVLHDGEVAKKLGLPGIPSSAEEAMVAREIVLSQETGAHVHIAHISTEGSAALIRDAKARGVHVTCETCPHYLLLDETGLLEGDPNFKMNPPLRRREDVSAILDAVADGTVDAIATDHAPHTREEKAVGLAKAPNGILGFQTALSVSYTALKDRMSLSDLLYKLTAVPADLLRLPAGRLEEGGPADLILFDPRAAWTVEERDLVSKSKNSPFIGMTLQGRVKYTFVAGNPVNGGANGQAD